METYRSVPGVGVFVPESQDGLYSSAGAQIESGGIWHLELSALKHLILTTSEKGSFYLVLKVFKELKIDSTSRLVSTPEHVLDRSQVIDLFFCLPDMCYTVRRAEIREVSFLFLISGGGEGPSRNELSVV